MWTDDQHEVAWERAYDLHFMGRTQEAKAVFEEALQEARVARDEAFVLFFEANLAWLRGDYPKALEDLQRALEIEPNNLVITRNLAVALDLVNMPFDALERFDRVLAARPDDYRALASRALALRRLGRCREALQSIRKALEIAPDYLYALRGRAILLGLVGTTDEAVAAFREYLAKNPSDEEAKVWLSRFAPPPEAQATIEEMARKRLAEENERLRAAQEARDQKVKLDAWRSLSARSAHRIGNQLFASLGALRTLKNIQSPDAAEAVSDMEASLDRVRRIIQEFQTFSRNEQPRLLPTDIGPLLRDIARRYSGLAKNIQLSADVPGSLPACLLDRDQIDQALGELLENALHHTPAGGRIRLAAEAIGEKVRIAIEDTGPGIPDSDKERIFEAFFSRRPGGSGLGLAIVKQIVENHGGTIRETGMAGSGARFEIDLPAQSSKEG